MKQTLLWTGIVLLGGASGLALASTEPGPGLAADAGLDALIDDAVLATAPQKREECREDDPERQTLCPDAREGLRPADVTMPATRDEELARQRATGLQPDLTGNGRSTFRSFHLAQMDSGTLDSIGLEGLRGINRDLVPRPQVSASELFGRLLDPSPRQINEVASIVLDRATIQTGILNTVLRFGDDGSSYVKADVSTQPGGLDMVIDTDVVATVYLVDSDGLSNTSKAGQGYDPAGALVAGPLRVSTTGLTVALRGDSASSRLTSYVSAPNGISVDLSGTRLGAADAVADGSAIGQSTPFLYLDGMLQIEPGMTLRAEINAPDANTPLLTLNGRIGDLMISNIRLVDNNSGGEISIGRLGISGINLVNTRVFFDNDVIILDMGSGLTNLGMSIERLALGSTGAGFLGDLYMSNGHLHSGRITFTTH